MGVAERRALRPWQPAGRMEADGSRVAVDAALASAEVVSSQDGTSEEVGQASRAGRLAS
jgi:hypothetical protein